MDDIYIIFIATFIRKIEFLRRRQTNVSERSFFKQIKTNKGTVQKHNIELNYFHA